MKHARGKSVPVVSLAAVAAVAAVAVMAAEAVVVAAADGAISGARRIELRTHEPVRRFLAVLRTGFFCAQMAADRTASNVSRVTDSKWGVRGNMSKS